MIFAIIFYPIFFISICIKYIYYKKIIEINQRLMKDFAENNNFVYESISEVREESTYEFLKSSIGSNRLFGCLNGDYNNYKMKITDIVIFALRPDIMRGYSVFESEIKEKLPVTVILNHIKYIDGSLDYVSINGNSSDVNKEMILDGLNSEIFKTESNEFDNNFSVFIEKDKENVNELKILEIFSPDIMNTMLEIKKEISSDFFIKVNCNKMSIYRPGFIKNEKELQRFLSLLAELLKGAEK